MFRIKLIVTGDMEKGALRQSLQTCFPDRRGGRRVEWLEARKEQGTTTRQIQADEPPSRPMKALAKVMLTEVRKSKTIGQQPPDLVVAIDDLELGNLGREDVVVRHFRAAMRDVLDSYDEKTQARGALPSPRQMFLSPPEPDGGVLFLRRSRRPPRGRCGYTRDPKARSPFRRGAVRDERSHLAPTLPGRESEEGSGRPLVVP
jgi:hypothetical protein